MKELTEEELQQVNGGKGNGLSIVTTGVGLLCVFSFLNKRCKKYDSVDPCKCLEYDE